MQLCASIHEEKHTRKGWEPWRPCPWVQGLNVDWRPNGMFRDAFHFQSLWLETLILLHDVPSIGRVWLHEKMLNDCVACCARARGKEAEEPLLHPGPVPEDSGVMGKGQGLLEKTVPGPGWGADPRGHPPAVHNWSSGAPALQLVGPRTAPIYSHFLMPGSEREQERPELFSSYQYIPVPSKPF